MKMQSWWKATLILSRISSRWTVVGTAEGTVGKPDVATPECTDLIMLTARVLPVARGPIGTTHPGCGTNFARLDSDAPNGFCDVLFVLGLPAAYSPSGRGGLREHDVHVCVLACQSCTFMCARLCVCLSDHGKDEFMLLVCVVHSQTCQRPFG